MIIIHGPITFTAKISSLVLWFWPTGIPENMLMLDFLQVKWTEVKCGVLSLLPLLGGFTNRHMEKGGISDPSSLPSIYPRRNLSHLGISVLKSNK